MLIAHPDGTRGGVTTRLTSAVDLFPTIAEAADVTVDTRLDGASLLPLVREPAGAPHQGCVTYGTFGQGICVTDGQWTLVKAPAPDGDLAAGTLAGLPIVLLAVFAHRYIVSGLTGGAVK